MTASNGKCVLEMRALQIVESIKTCRKQNMLQKVSNYVEQVYRGYVARYVKIPSSVRRYKQMTTKQIHEGQRCGWVDRRRSLEAVQSALLLALLLCVVEGGHASFKVGALGFNAKAGVALLFHGLKRVAGCAAFLAHHVQLFL